MPDYAQLYVTTDGKPDVPPPDGSERELGYAVDYVPLGWLALFTASDLIDMLSPGGPACLTLFTRVATARENLSRRRAVLCEVFEWIDVDDYIDHLDELLARADASHHIQIWAAGLVYPWPLEARDMIAGWIKGLDTRDAGAWEAILASVDADRVELRDGKLRGVFRGGVPVNACVGHLVGKPAEPDPGRPADFREVGDRFHQLKAGRGRTWWDAEQFIEELVSGARELAGEGERLFQAAFDQDEDWLDARIREAPPPLRAAIYARCVASANQRNVDEPDPNLRRALVALRAATTVSSGDPVVLETLRDPDPRVRAMLARNYRGGGDPDLDEDDDGNPRPAEIDDVWTRLVADPDERVRVALLWNSRTPLRPPVNDPSAVVRAYHPDTTTRELRALAKYHDAHVLEGVYFHKHSLPAFRSQIWRRLQANADKIAKV